MYEKVIDDLRKASTILERTEKILGIIPVRTNTMKERISNLLKASGVNPTDQLIDAVDVVHVQDAEELREVIQATTKALDAGRTVAVRITDLEKERGKPGGLLTVEVVSKEQLPDDSESEQMVITSLDGKAIVIPAWQRKVEIFSRYPSTNTEVTGLAGVRQTMRTGCGGGFRLAMEGLSAGDGPESIATLDMVAEFGFGDGSPRRLNDPNNPHVLLQFGLPIAAGGLLVPPKLQENYEQARKRVVEANQKGQPLQAGDVVNMSLWQMMHQYYERAVRLLLASNAAFPLPRAAQLEGLWSLQEDTRIVGGLEPTAVITDLEGGWSMWGNKENPLIRPVGAMRLMATTLQDTRLHEVYPMNVAERMREAARWAEFANTVASLNLK